MGVACVAGLVGGGPVFLGALIGYNVTSQPLELAFYGLSGGAILYVIGEVWSGCAATATASWGCGCWSAGFISGVVTDLIVVYGGG